ncbi:MAG TPA: S9 family peptidase [Ktedonobacterales bacterium]|jgi:dipeptidyl aminopeptidase/acylaminoacyl peptidase
MAKRPLTLEDFWSLKLVSEPQVSPDGASVAYVVGGYDETHNTLHSAIWLAALPDGQTRQFTSGETQDMQPAWSPDGKRLAFVSARHESKPQIFVMDVSGGEARRLTTAPDGATSPVWSPDGKRLCYSSGPETDEQQIPQEVDWLKAHADLEKSAPRLRLQRALQTRFDGRGFLDRRSHLFLIAVDEPGAEPRQLTTGNYDDGQAVWSPDGALIAFVANRQKDAEHTFAADIWTVDVESGELKRLTDGSLSASFPAWSPNGQTLAFYADLDMTRHPYYDTQVWIVSRAGGDQRNLTASLDRGWGGIQPDYLFPDPAAPAWAPDGKSLYFTVGDQGSSVIFALSLESGETRRVSNDAVDVARVSCAADGKTLVCLAATATQPYEVCVVPASGGSLRFITETNRALLEEVTLAAPERISFTGPDDWEIEGWLYKPNDAERRRPYPLILHVHGGPNGSWGHSFFFQAQALAGAGYASLYLNPRGSNGYGVQFARAADWGKKDYLDLMAGVDAVLAGGEVDPARLGVTGISYGGYMTNWIVGHTTRFAAAVSVNGISNLTSFYGVSDIGALWFPPKFGDFWASEESWRLYREHSPITYVANIATPLLLLQAENDYRCPIEQGEQMLSALRVRRQTVELIRFPGASHIIAASAAPLHRYFQWKLTLDWFERYLKGEQSKAAEEAAPVGAAVEGTVQAPHE